MKKALYITLIVLAGLVIAGGLVAAGTWIGHMTSYNPMQNWNGMMNDGYRSNYGPGMMNGGNRSNVGPGMMNGGNTNGYWQGMNYDPQNCSYVTGVTGCGMVDGNGYGNGYGPGMMQGYTNSSATPISIDQAYQAARDYLDSLNNADLKIAEVMVFENNAYIRVVEESTGTGAFELLVNHATLAVTPEPGPNMMWNLKYGMHRGMGGMMGPYITSGNVDEPMTVSEEQALQDAQAYLDANLPGTTTAEDADAFYGYYTIDILRNGEHVGMLSVNGYSGQVWFHTWHGDFVDMQEY